MSPVEAEVLYRAAQRAEPAFAHDLLDRVVRALPPPPDDASVAWRQAHLRRVIDELSAFAPFTPIDAMMAAQMVIMRRAAADTLRRSVDATLPMTLAIRMRRSAETMLRTAGQTERLLRRQQAGRTPEGGALVEVPVDLAALDAIWCGHPEPSQPPRRNPDGEADAIGVVAPLSPASPRKATSPTPRGRYTLCGQRIDLVQLETIPAAGTA